jgi:hypothetical protein
VLDTPVAREIYGEAAHRLATPAPPLVEAALEQLLFDAGERARLVLAGRDVASRYSWATSARETLAALTGARG